MKLFLDTNVLIDFILERQPFYQAAAMIISYAEENKVQICVSSLSLVTTNFICIALIPQHYSLTLFISA